jgi:hypothetical protein
MKQAGHCSSLNTDIKYYDKVHDSPISTFMLIICDWVHSLPRCATFFADETPEHGHAMFEWHTYLHFKLESFPDMIYMSDVLYCIYYQQESTALRGSKNFTEILRP